MTFVDILTSQLFVLGFIGFILLYMTLEIYLSYRKGKKNADVLSSASIPLALLGAYAVITGLYGQFAWPLPGPYNILFYDVFTLLGLLMLALSWSIRAKEKLHYIGALSFLMGVMVVYYGVNGYLQHLTEVPFYLLLLYLGFGVSGILGLPVTIMLDRINDGVKNKSMAWKLIVGLFVLALFLASLLAVMIAVLAVPAHLLSPP